MGEDLSRALGCITAEYRFHLQEFIAKGTNGEGVNLMMADGGFSVKGQENIQVRDTSQLVFFSFLTSKQIVLKCFHH